ncbi:hypothetical protein LTR35_001963 [Friedmanniomyces endolithicus]|uniref:Uncharacterized protein n=1 Tax=Friedmanniomyces endolithicus TaxID=329885 RepID=A0AAN6FXI1_9PEZI|nr:hypothetical protein LTR35_001963 [Friedmanniomyces endolithicus]KAK0325233.1 hypothetical protein LTR82_003514 [Friedmanniomyces endolithicus]KAK0996878.1 hypothetical protein LTR54_009954 [Friedmanniomyces endolithicus]
MAIEHASEEKSMHFFRFPQELRDRIYNCLTHNLKKPEVGPGAQKLGAVIRNAPIQRLLVLSKRFKYKYEMEVQRTMTLVISDDRPAPVLPILLGSLSRILRHVEVRMVEILGPGLLSASADDVGNAITKLQHRGVNMIKTAWLTGQLDRVEFKARLKTVCTISSQNRSLSCSRRGWQRWSPRVNGHRLRRGVAGVSGAPEATEGLVDDGGGLGALKVKR